MKRSLALLALILASACESIKITQPPMPVTISGPIAYGMYPNEALPLSAKLSDSQGREIINVKLTWTVADTSIAYLDRENVLHARKRGRTSFTLTVTDSRFVATPWTCLVNVQ